jgi:hypothetical protein
MLKSIQIYRNNNLPQILRIFRNLKRNRENLLVNPNDSRI